MSLIRYVLLLLIFYQYDLVSSDDSSSDKMKSFAVAKGFELIENVTSVRKEEETRQLNAVRRRLQQHPHLIEMTYVRQSLQQKVSKLKQELQAYIRQHKETIICKQLHGKSRDMIQNRMSTTPRTIKTGNIATVCRHENLTLNVSCEADGLAISNDKLFVGCNDGLVKVYDLTTLSFLRNLSIPGLQCASDMTSCPQCDVVYISDWCNKTIHVIDENGLRVQWNAVAHKPVSHVPRDRESWGLSVNSKFNVVVSFRLSLLEITPSGQLVRKITLHSDTSPSHAIQLDDDRFVVVGHCYSFDFNKDSSYRVYIINSTGTVIQSFLGYTTSTYLLCGHEVRLLLIGDSLIVTNKHQNRLLLFNVSPLTYVRELTELDKMPHQIAVTDDDTRLFVSAAKEIRVFDVVLV